VIEARGVSTIIKGGRVMISKYYVAAALFLTSGSAYASQTVHTDPTGTVQIIIERCVGGAPAEFNAGSCSVPTLTGGLMNDGYVLVGGGGVVSPSIAPGALLVSSYMDPSHRDTWLAVSKDHGGLTFPHTLDTFAIGLSIKDVPSATLRSSNNVQIFVASATGSHPAATAYVEPGYIMVGGGAKVTYNGNGLLLNQSHVNGDGSGWFASAKDHGQPDTGTIKVWAIGLRSKFFANAGLTTRVKRLKDCGGGTGFWSAQLNLPSNALITGVGGEAEYHGNGRLLTVLQPFGEDLTPDTGVFVQSKDHQFPDTGCTDAASIGIGHL